MRRILPILLLFIVLSSISLSLIDDDNDGFADDNDQRYKPDFCLNTNASDRTDSYGCSCAQKTDESSINQPFYCKPLDQNDPNSICRERCGVFDFKAACNVSATKEADLMVCPESRCEGNSLVKYGGSGYNKCVDGKLVQHKCEIKETMPNHPDCFKCSDGTKYGECNSNGFYCGIKAENKINLIGNAGFEKGEEGYTKRGNAVIDGTSLVNENGIKIGSKSAKLASYNDAFYHKPIPLAAGKYRFSAYASGKCNRIRLYFEENGRWTNVCSFSSNKCSDWKADVRNKDEKWQKISDSFDIGPNSIEDLRVVCEDSGNFEFWVDGMTLEKEDFAQMPEFGENEGVCGRKTAPIEQPLIQKEQPQPTPILPQEQPLMPTAQLPIQILKGDFDGDCNVDLEDFFDFAAIFGKEKGDAEYDGKFNIDNGDESKNKIDLEDFFAFANEFGKSSDYPKTNDISVSADREKDVRTKLNVDIGYTDNINRKGNIINPRNIENSDSLVFAKKDVMLKIYAKNSEKPIDNAVIKAWFENDNKITQIVLSKNLKYESDLNYISYDGFIKLSEINSEFIKLTVTFSDGAGGKIEKSALIKIRDKKIDFSCKKILDNGPNENKINIVLAADSYLQTSKFDADIDRYLYGIKDDVRSSDSYGFFTIEPIKSNKEKFNVFKLSSTVNFNCGNQPTDTDIPCEESGIREIVSQSCGIGKADVIIMIGDYQFRGWASYSGFAKATNPYTTVHEFGHAFAQLGDEYWADYDKTYMDFIENQGLSNIDVEGCSKWCSGKINSKEPCYEYYQKWKECAEPYKKYPYSNEKELESCWVKYNDLSNEKTKTFLNDCNIGTDCREETQCYFTSHGVGTFRHIRNALMGDGKEHRYGIISEEKIQTVIDSYGQPSGRRLSKPATDKIIWYDNLDKSGKIISGGHIDLTAMTAGTKSKLLAKTMEISKTIGSQETKDFEDKINNALTTKAAKPAKSDPEIEKIEEMIDFETKEVKTETINPSALIDAYLQIKESSDQEIKKLDENTKQDMLKLLSSNTPKEEKQRIQTRLAKYATESKEDFKKVGTCGGINIPASEDALIKGDLATDNVKKLIGDFNNDCQVNMDDFYELKTAYNTKEAKYDLDKDGDVDLGDFFDFALEFGNECEEKAEPKAGKPARAGLAKTGEALIGDFDGEGCVDAKDRVEANLHLQNLYSKRPSDSKIIGGYPQDFTLQSSDVGFSNELQALTIKFDLNKDGYVFYLPSYGPIELAVKDTKIWSDNYNKGCMKVDAQCGTASSDIPSNAMPAKDLCAPNRGTNSQVQDKGDKWEWDCLGANGGSNVKCRVPKKIQPETPATDCSKMGTEELRNGCHMFLAVSKRDISLCSNIKDTQSPLTEEQRKINEKNLKDYCVSKVEVFKQGGLQKPAATQLECGNNKVEQGEECDGTADTKAEGALYDGEGICSERCGFEPATPAWIKYEKSISVDGVPRKLGKDTSNNILASISKPGLTAVIQKFSSDGNDLGVFSDELLNFKRLSNDFESVWSFAVDKTGWRYVIVKDEVYPFDGSWNYNRRGKFDPNRQLKSTKEHAGGPIFTNIKYDNFADALVLLFYHGFAIYKPDGSLIKEYVADYISPYPRPIDAAILDDKIIVLRSDGYVYSLDNKKEFIQNPNIAEIITDLKIKEKGILKRPKAIETDGRHIYILDTDPLKVHIFGLDGLYIGSFATQASVKDEQNRGGLLHNNGALYVVDASNKRIEKYIISAQASKKPVGTALAKTDGCSIYGIIKDEEGYEVVQASVKLLSPSGMLISQTTTGTNGDYCLESINPGKYSLSISALTYASQAKGIELRSNDKIESNFKLKIFPFQVNEVVQQEKRLTPAIVSGRITDNLGIPLKRGNVLMHILTINGINIDGVIKSSGKKAEELFYRESGIFEDGSFLMGNIPVGSSIGSSTWVSLIITSPGYKTRIVTYDVYEGSKYLAGSSFFVEGIKLEPIQQAFISRLNEINIYDSRKNLLSASGSYSHVDTADAQGKPVSYAILTPKNSPIYVLAGAKGSVVIEYSSPQSLKRENREFVYKGSGEFTEYIEYDLVVRAIPPGGKVPEQTASIYSLGDELAYFGGEVFDKDASKKDCLDSTPLGKLEGYEKIALAEVTECTTSPTVTSKCKVEGGKMITLPLCRNRCLGEEVECGEGESCQTSEGVGRCISKTGEQPQFEYIAKIGDEKYYIDYDYPLRETADKNVVELDFSIPVFYDTNGRAGFYIYTTNMPIGFKGELIEVLNYPGNNLAGRIKGFKLHPNWGYVIDDLTSDMFNIDGKKIGEILKNNGNLKPKKVMPFFILSLYSSPYGGELKNVPNDNLIVVDTLQPTLHLVGRTNKWLNENDFELKINEKPFRPCCPTNFLDEQGSFDLTITNLDLKNLGLSSAKEIILEIIVRYNNENVISRKIKIAGTGDIIDIKGFKLKRHGKTADLPYTSPSLIYDMVGVIDQLSKDFFKEKPFATIVLKDAPECNAAPPQLIVEDYTMLSGCFSLASKYEDNKRIVEDITTHEMAHVIYDRHYNIPGLLGDFDGIYNWYIRFKMKEDKISNTFGKPSAIAGNSPLRILQDCHYTNTICSITMQELTGHPWDTANELHASAFMIYRNHADLLVKVIHGLTDGNIRKALPEVFQEIMNGMNESQRAEMQEVLIDIWKKLKDVRFKGKVFTSDGKDPFPTKGQGSLTPQEQQLQTALADTLKGGIFFQTEASVNSLIKNAETGLPANDFNKILSKANNQNPYVFSGKQVSSIEGLFKSARTLGSGVTKTFELGGFISDLHVGSIANPTNVKLKSTKSLGEHKFTVEIEGDPTKEKFAIGVTLTLNSEIIVVKGKLKQDKSGNYVFDDDGFAMAVGEQDVYAMNANCDPNKPTLTRRTKKAAQNFLSKVSFGLAKTGEPFCLCQNIADPNDKIGCLISKIENKETSSIEKLEAIKSIGNIAKDIEGEITKEHPLTKAIVILGNLLEDKSLDADTKKEAILSAGNIARLLPLNMIDSTDHPLYKLFLKVQFSIIQELYNKNYDENLKNKFRIIGNLPVSFNPNKIIFGYGRAIVGDVNVNGLSEEDTRLIFTHIGDYIYENKNDIISKYGIDYYEKLRSSYLHYASNIMHYLDYDLMISRYVDRNLIANYDRFYNKNWDFENRRFIYYFCSNAGILFDYSKYFLQDHVKRDSKIWSCIPNLLDLLSDKNITSELKEEIIKTLKKFSAVNGFKPDDASINIIKQKVIDEKDQNLKKKYVVLLAAFAGRSESRNSEILNFLRSNPILVYSDLKDTYDNEFPVNKLIIFSVKQFNDVYNRLEKTHPEIKEDSKKFSISIAVLRYIDGDVGKTDSGIDFIMKKRAEFANFELINDKSHLIFITHNEKDTAGYKGYRFDNEKIINFAERIGVKDMPEKSLKGPEGKKRFLQLVKDSKDKKDVVIWLDGHGSEDAVWLAEGDYIPMKTGGETLPKEQRRISSEELGDALIERGKDNLAQVRIIVGACFSYNFAENLNNYLAKNGATSSPTVVAITNKNNVGASCLVEGEYSYSCLLNSYNRVYGDRKNQPFIGQYALDAEEFMFDKQDNGVFFGSDKGPSTEISSKDDKLFEQIAELALGNCAVAGTGGVIIDVKNALRDFITGYQTAQPKDVKTCLLPVESNINSLIMNIVNGMKGNNMEPTEQNFIAIVNVVFNENKEWKRFEEKIKDNFRKRDYCNSKCKDTDGLDKFRSGEVITYKPEPGQTFEDGTPYVKEIIKSEFCKDLHSVEEAYCDAYCEQKIEIIECGNGNICAKGETVNIRPTGGILRTDPNYVPFNAARCVQKISPIININGRPIPDTITDFNWQISVQIPGEQPKSMKLYKKVLPKGGFMGKVNANLQGGTWNALMDATDLDAGKYQILVVADYGTYQKIWQNDADMHDILYTIPYKVLFVPVNWEEGVEDFKRYADEQFEFFVDAFPFRDCPERAQNVLITPDTLNCKVNFREFSSENIQKATQEFNSCIMSGVGKIPNIITNFDPKKDYSQIIAPPNYNIVVGLLSEEPYHNIGGFMAKKDLRTIFVLATSKEKDEKSVEAFKIILSHETGHIYGLREEYTNYLDTSPVDSPFGVYGGFPNELKVEYGCNPESGKGCCGPIGKCATTLGQKQCNARSQYFPVVRENAKKDGTIEECARDQNDDIKCCWEEGSNEECCFKSDGSFCGCDQYSACCMGNLNKFDNRGRSIMSTATAQGPRGFSEPAWQWLNSKTELSCPKVS